MQLSFTDVRKNTESHTKDTSSILMYRESGILPIRFLIKKETATYIVKTATKPMQTDIIHRIQEETQKDPRVFNNASWSIKTEFQTTAR